MRRSKKAGLCKLVFSPKTAQEKTFYVEAWVAGKMLTIAKRFRKTLPTKRSVLRERRLAKKMTQAKLADCSGLDQGHISALETGRVPMSEYSARMLAEGLGCRWRSLLG